MSHLISGKSPQSVPAGLLGTQTARVSVGFGKPLSEIADLTVSCVRVLVPFWLPFPVGAEQGWLCGSQRERTPASPPRGLEGLGSASAAFAGLPARLHNPPQVHTQASGHPESDANTTPHPRQWEPLPRGGVPSPRGSALVRLPGSLWGHGD